MKLDGTKRIDLLLLITAHAIIVCGLMCVVLTGQIPVPLWLLALAAHPLSILMRSRQGRYFFNTIVILAFGYFLLLYFVLQTPFLDAFTQFLIVVQAVKLFYLEKAKDYLQLAGLGLFTVLAAAGLTTQFYYLFFLFTFLLVGIWFLFLLHLKRGIEQQSTLSPPPRALTSPSIFAGISAVAFCSFIITIFIFFALPRITLSVSGTERWGGTSTGFSETVDLGTVGSVRLDNRVVMRVELPQFNERPPFPLYWRGTSYARWNGQTWERGDTVEKIPRTKGGGIILHNDKGDTEAIYQIIMIEPLGTDILFCLYPPLEIRGRFSHVLIDEGGGIHLPSEPYGRYNYEVYSASRLRRRRYDGITAKPQMVHLLVPEGKKTLVPLAHKITAGATSADEKVQRVISYLHNTCTYSLNPRRDERFPPLEDFLAHSREGYCEHFATAATLLLRATGVPTRLASGFAQGEWNALGRYVMVRQRDAHTWIETYLPDKGWVPFDPTPTAEPQPTLPLVSSVYRYYDFLKLKWNRYIIRYSRRDQVRFLLAFRKKVMALRLFPRTPSMHGFREKTAHYSSFFLIAVAAAFCVLLIVWTLKKRKRTAGIGIHRAGTPPSEISFYLKILKILKKNAEIMKLL